MLKVLLVDDEPALRDIGKFYLEQREEFQVEIAEDGEIALEKILSSPFHVIISDYDMPNMNGIELLRLVKSNLPKQPFIIFTGKGREEVVIDALNLGADFYLQKGGEIKSQYTELAHKCRRAAERRATMDQISHLARLYSFSSSVNKCVYSFRRKDELINEISKIAVHEGGFFQIIITLTNPVHGHPEVAAIGKSEECTVINEKLTSSELLPTRYALSKGRYHICADHRTYNHHTREEKELYIQQGILSSASFPIHVRDKIIGSITFHSCEPDFFNEEEALLLIEITETLSFGFEFMDKNSEQEKLEEHLQIAWYAIDASLTPIFLLDFLGKIVYGNTALLSHMGLNNDLLQGSYAYLTGLVTYQEWEQILNCPEKGEKIRRDTSDDPLKQGKEEILSIRPFQHQSMPYFWIRIEKP